MSERVVLDREDLRRTLVRIAHEIVEKNRVTIGRGLAIVGIHTRGAVLAERLHALVGELTGAEVPLGDLDISFYRDDVGAARPAADAPVVHASHLDFDLGGRTVVLVDDVLFTGRTVRAAIDALFDYGRPHARPARRPRRPRPPRAADPPRLHRQEHADGTRGAGLRPPRGGRRTSTRSPIERRPGRRGGERRGSTMRHLLSIEDLERDDVERILERADSFAEVGRRDIKKVPTLRGRTIVNLFYESSTRTSSSFELAAKRLSADVVSVKAGGLLRRQGRVAEGHRRDPLRLRARGDRDPLPARRRRATGHRLDRGRRRQRRRRQARAPEPGPARRLHAAASASARSRASGSGSSATSCTAASPAPARSGLRPDGRGGHASAARRR